MHPLTTPLPYAAAAAPFVESLPADAVRAGAAVATLWMAFAVGRLIYLRHTTGTGRSVPQQHWVIGASYLAFLTIAEIRRITAPGMRGVDGWTAATALIMVVGVMAVIRRHRGRYEALPR